MKGKAWRRPPKNYEALERKYLKYKKKNYPLRFNDTERNHGF
ncbi:MAG: hypothetical protein NTY48_06550 [Candidatus Diapherotrites archaeon]|nr:hypothetical protein [Candidatus Diapherotrites archaeon]